MKEITKYAAIIVAAGDGTINDVVNGMVLREDQQMVPIGMVPFGSGNDS